MEWYASQGMTSSTEQSSIFFWGELQLSEMGLNKVATGNWILESGERQKKIKISGTLRVVIVFRPWEFSANKKKKETKTSMSFFYRSLDVCFILPCSGWSFYWKLLPMLCAVFRKRVLEGSNYKYSGLSSKPRNLKWQLFEGLVIQLGGLKRRQWLKNLWFMSLQPPGPTQSHKSTCISLETTALLGQKDAGQTSWPRCLFLEGKNHNGNWTWV